MSNWPMVPLKEVLDPVSRPESVEPEKTYRVLGAHWYANGLYTKETLTGTEIQASKVYRIEQGDFVYNRLFAWKGSFAVATSENDGCYVSNEFPCFRGKPDRIDVCYLWRYFGRQAAWTEALGLSKGGTPTSRNRLKEEAFLQLEVPLPPLKEQRRLVERIEALAAKIEEAKGLRKEANRETKAFGHSYINEIYENLRAEYNVSMLADVALGITDGTHLTPTFSDDGVKFIFVGNVSSGSFHFNGCRFVSRSYYNTVAESRRPRRGDVLYSAVGATLGIPAVVDTDEEFCFQRHVAIIKLDQNQLHSRYLWYMLRSGVLFQKAWASITGTAQPTVPLKAIRKLPLPVPPIAEQQRLVSYLDELHTKVRSVASRQEEASNELDAMLPAILDRAFRGEL